MPCFTMLCTELAVVSAMVAISHLALGKQLSNVFQQYEIQPGGCKIFPRFQTKLECVLACQSSPQCHMFAFETECQICSGSDISDLNFASGLFYFFKEHACWDSIAPNSTRTLPVPLSYGMVIRFTLTIKVNESLGFNFEKPSTNAIQFHLGLRVPDGYANVNAFKGKAWGANVKISNPFPFEVGQTTHIRVLITPGKYVIFFDDVHAADFPHQQPVEDSSSFRQGPGFTNLDQVCY